MTHITEWDPHLLMPDAVARPWERSLLPSFFFKTTPAQPESVESRRHSVRSQLPAPRSPFPAPEAPSFEPEEEGGVSARGGVPDFPAGIASAAPRMAYDIRERA